MTFARSMDGDRELEYHADTAGATMYDAGPDTDPSARLAFDCDACGRADLLVARTRIEALTTELLKRCLADDTPRERVVTISA
jgi:hypothetical protein